MCGYLIVLLLSNTDAMAICIIKVMSNYWAHKWYLFELLEVSTNK
ncbi:hypothetical protein T12_4811 [Trichinella patagoniensis]|uniref:Uncharacterized protein n=1 Tax=Trichinella patagoniensis TaxID=990121 RepID=A0A0V0YY09_9BILA|nr:hypothetical protein T12_4811 [Trichinella patagoniensis]